MAVIICTILHIKNGNSMNTQLPVKDNNDPSKSYTMQATPSDGVKHITNCKTTENFESDLHEKKENNLDDILSDLKLSGKYHLRFLLLLCVLLFFTAEFAVQYIFTAENVNYRCKYSNCEDIEISKLEQNSTLDYKCHKYDTLGDNGSCTEDNFDKSSVTECSEWVYDEPNSFVADFDLGCEDWKRTLVGTMHSAGYMTGLLLLGPMSDKFGRKNIIIFNALASGTIGILKSMATSYWMFIALETIEPMLGDNFSTVYTLVMEMVTTKSRPIVILVFSVTMTFSDMILAVLAYFSPTWRIFLVLLYTPAFFFISYIYWLDESVRWLLIKEKKAKAEQILKKAYKINNIAIDQSKIVNLKSDCSSNATLWASLKDTFSSRKLFIRLILCIFIWFTSLFNAYAVMINFASLEGNKYINYGFLSLASSVAGVILFYMLTKFQRKKPLIFTSILTGVFCISQSFLPKGYRWLSVLLYLSGKINVIITIRTIYLYTVELFPTYTRNSMLALCSSLGRIGAVLAPLTPLLVTYWSGLPSFLVGILSLVTALVVTLLPDTAENVLPDNAKQAESIGCK